MGTKFFIVNLSVPIILVVMLLMYNLYQQTTIQNKSKEQLAKSGATFIIDKFDRIFYERVSDTKEFIQNELVLGGIEDSIKGRELLKKHLDQLIFLNKSYDLFMICDTKGDVIASTDKSSTQNQFMQEWYRSSLAVGGPSQGVFFSDVNRDEESETGLLGIDFSVPIKREDGTLVGVWRSRINWEKIALTARKETENTIQSSDGVILLFNKQGLLIETSDRKQLFKTSIGKNNIGKNFPIRINGKDWDDDTSIYGWYQSSRQNSLATNQWSSLVLIPKEEFTLAGVIQNRNSMQLIMITFILLLASLFITSYFNSQIVRRIKKLKEIIVNLSEGEFPEIKNTNQKDEIGQMLLSTQRLTIELAKKSQFASAIGEGNWKENLELSGIKDTLGQSLLTMKQNLVLLNEKSLEEKWVTQQLSKILDIFKDSNGEELYNKFVSVLCKCAQFRMGCLYLESIEFSDQIILSGNYAISEFTPKILYIGEGQTGQAFVNKEMIVLENFPDDFVKITSGLGEAVPRTIIIMPVLYQNNCLGVLELLSFNSLNERTITLIQKSLEHLSVYIMKERNSSFKLEGQG